MKRPAIQLYFGDLFKNPKVKRCSWAARGALVWTMGLFHDSDEYGMLHWPLDEIAQAVGCPMKIMQELAIKGAIKGHDIHCPAYLWAPSHAGTLGPEVVLIREQEGPLWYSARMVRDEYLRNTRGATTRFGVNPSPKETPSRRVGETPSQRQGDGASSSSSVSKELKPLRRVEPDGFRRFWSAYPATRRRVAKVKCLGLWVAQGFESLSDAILAHVSAMKDSQQWGDGYEPAPLTYLNQRRWEDGLPAAAKTSSRLL